MVATSLEIVIIIVLAYFNKHEPNLGYTEDRTLSMALVHRLASGTIRHVDTASEFASETKRFRSGHNESTRRLVSIRTPPGIFLSHHAERLVF